MPRIIKMKRKTVEESSHQNLSNGELLFTAMEKYGYDSAVLIDGKLKKTLVAIEKFKEAIGKEEYDDPKLTDCKFAEFISTSISETVNNPFLILQLHSQSDVIYELVSVSMLRSAGDVTLKYIICKKDIHIGTISFFENNEWVPKIEGMLAKKLIFFSRLNPNFAEAFFYMIYPFKESKINDIESFISILDSPELAKDISKICSLNDQMNNSGVCHYHPLIGFFMIPRCPNLMGSAIRCRNGKFELLFYITEKQLRCSLKSQVYSPSYEFSAMNKPIEITKESIFNTANYLIGAYNGKYPVIRTLLPNGKAVSIPFLRKEDLDEDSIVRSLNNPFVDHARYTDSEVSEILTKLSQVKEWLKNSSVLF